MRNFGHHDVRGDAFDRPFAKHFIPGVIKSVIAVARDDPLMLWLRVVQKSCMDFSDFPKISLCTLSQENYVSNVMYSTFCV